MKKFNLEIPDLQFGESYIGLAQGTGINSQNKGFGEKNKIISEEILIRNFNILNLNKGDFVMHDFNGIGINTQMLKIFYELNNEYLTIISLLNSINGLVVNNGLTKVNPGHINI